MNNNSHHLQIVSPGFYPQTSSTKCSMKNGFHSQKYLGKVINYSIPSPLKRHKVVSGRWKEAA